MMISWFGKSKSLLGLVFLVLCQVELQSFAATDSNQPYIDQVRRQLDQSGKGSEEASHDAGQNQPQTPDPYIQSIKKKMEAEGSKGGRSGESYTEKLKVLDPILKKAQESKDQPYSESEKAKIEPKPEGGTIQAVLEGKSELKPKKKGEIRHAFGLRYGASLSRQVTGSALVQDFNNVYGKNYAPDVTLFYEIQPFHSETYGNIGFMGIGGLAYFHGVGQFAFTVQKPGGGTFSNSSSTQFQFFTLPATLAVNYRFNLFRYLRPYVFAGPSAVGFVEKRNDGGQTNKGYSFGLLGAAGVAFALDWISAGNSWDMYADYGVHHYYVTLEYSRLSTYTGILQFTTSGLTAGFTFEY